MSRLAVRSRAEEQMDAINLDAPTYARVLADLGRVNRLTLTHRPTLRFLREALGDRTTFRLLDVGFGHGDMLREISRWAMRSGRSATLVGIDLNANSAPAARAATPAGGIDYRTGDYADLAGEGFDLIVSSLVAHHMTDRQLIAFLRFMEAQARVGWFVNDLHRHTLAHFGYPWIARALGVHRIVREDGTLSIARGFRRGEWQALLDQAGISDARIVRRFPFRLCVERRR